MPLNRTTDECSNDRAVRGCIEARCRGPIGDGRIPSVHPNSVRPRRLAIRSRRGHRICSPFGSTLIVLDEAARVEDELLRRYPAHVGNVEWTAIALSTPRGNHGFFYEAWHGDESWHRVRVPASECPLIPQAFLDEELRELGEQRFAEEYRLEFIEDGDQVIRTEFFERASKQLTPRRQW